MIIMFIACEKINYAFMLKALRNKVDIGGRMMFN